VDREAPPYEDGERQAGDAAGLSGRESYGPFHDHADASGLGVRRVPSGDALARFLAKCRFDPGTGCVLWIGGTTCGHGKNSKYPAFWYEGKRWFGHRWAAKFIHGLEIEGMQVDHCCDMHSHLTHPNTLCVQHLQSFPPSINRELQWIRVQVGIDPAPIVNVEEPYTSIPFYPPPKWFPKDKL
jgi:hypothetical protein